MNSSASSQSRNLKPRSWLSSLVGVLLATAFIYVWILPLFRPRGEFLWGHYRLKDIYAGIPIALATLCVILVIAVPTRYRRSLSLRLTTSAIAILIAFAVCDAGYAFGVMGALRANFWLDQGHISRRYSTADAELGFVRKPRVSWRGYVPDADRMVEYSTDENGFRNSSMQQRADIVFIGDSFTEAATVAEGDTFVRRVEQSTGLRVVNLGRGAYGPQQELIVLRRYGLTYEPRVVVWQLFEGNDLADAEGFTEWKKNPQQVNTSLRERYFDNSLLKQWLTDTRSQARGGPMVTLRYHDGTVRRVSLRYRYEPEQPSTMRLGMTETMGAIEAGHQLCQSHGIQLLVVLVPTMVRVMAPNISFDRAEDQIRYLPERVRDDQKDFSDTMEEFCARIGCNFVDSFDVLRQAAANGNRNLYIPNDEHLDVGAHDVMAQVVVGWLRSKNLVSQIEEFPLRSLRSSASSASNGLFQRRERRDTHRTQRKNLIGRVTITKPRA